MIPSTFICVSLLASAGDFQIPGCNHFSLDNLTFHFDPLISTSGAMMLSAEKSFLTGQQALWAATRQGCSPHNWKVSCIRVQLVWKPVQIQGISLTHMSSVSNPRFPAMQKRRRGTRTTPYLRPPWHLSVPSKKKVWWKHKDHILFIL